MNGSSTTHLPQSPTPSSLVPVSGGWIGGVVLGVAVFVAYLANGREIGTYDTLPSTELTLTLLRGEGIYLDRFQTASLDSNGRLESYLTRVRGHLVSRHPVGPALLAVPFVAPQVAWLDRTAPGWDKDPGDAQYIARFMAKRASAAIAALVTVVLYLVSRRLGLRRTAWVATLAAALGSDLFAVASQALWQHGPAALASISVIGLLLPRELGRGRMLLAGIVTAALVVFRAIDVVLAGCLLAYVAWQLPERLVWFLPGPLTGAVALLGYNLYYFDSIAGGQSQLESLHASLHGASGPWAGNLVDGMLGSLLSPNRGLFVFSPWVALALATLPATWKRLRSRPVLRWMTCGLVPYLLLLSQYAVWWGGHSFGPRYWTDAIPLFAILFGFGLEWALERARLLAALMAVAVIWSVLIQAVGTFCYPSSWNSQPANVDQHHERLWDWRDTELRRCLIDGTRHRMASPAEVIRQR